MKLPLIFSFTGAAVTALPLGAYSFSRESIQDKVYGHCILKTAGTEGWKLAEENLKKESSNSELISPFKEIYDKIKVDNFQITGNELKNICIDLYSWDNSSIFKSENQKLTEQTKKYCGLKIKERLGESNIFGKENEESEIQEKIKLLSSQDNKKGVLTEKLKEAKDSNAFKKACEEIYEKPFLSEKTNDWILIENYCKKQSSR